MYIKEVKGNLVHLDGLQWFLLRLREIEGQEDSAPSSLPSISSESDLPPQIHLISSPPGGLMCPC